VQILVPGYLGSGLGAYAVQMIVRYTTGLVYRISVGLVAKGLERQTTCKQHAIRRKEQRWNGFWEAALSGANQCSIHCVLMMMNLSRCTLPSNHQCPCHP
jgi:hypothetical protein